jgi:salicylate hydroxylase
MGPTRQRGVPQRTIQGKLQVISLVHGPLTKPQDWNPTVKALTELTPSTNLYPNFAGDALPTWVFGSRATLIGDAAHAHGGSFAAGGSLALDDTLALGLAFKHGLAGKTTFSAADIDKTLRLYSQTRQPHTDRLLRIVHGQIDKKTAFFENAEAEDEALVARLKNRPSTEWLSEHDVEAAFVGAVGAVGAVGELDYGEAQRGGMDVGGASPFQGSKL